MSFFHRLSAGFIVGLALAAPGYGFKDVDVSGTYLGLVNYLSQNGAVRAQFDYAANVDVTFSLSKDVDGIVQFQGGTGNGSFGFGGPQLVVTDINIRHQSDPNGLALIFGSYDTPLGNETSALTNNADSFNNALLLNSLGFSALAGPVGTLNTLGIMAELPVSEFDITASLSNGTGENSVNEGNAFEGLIGIANDTLIPGLALSATYMKSDDRADAGNASGNGFGSDFSAWLVDGEFTLLSDISLSGYVGGYTYNDDDASTKDSVMIGMAEASYWMDRYNLAVRASGWFPEDRDGSGSGLSSAIPAPGLSTATLKDTSIIRVQGNIERAISNNLSANIEGMVDYYGHGNHVYGIIGYINGRF